jgi:hypothetical protein
VFLLVTLTVLKNWYDKGLQGDMHGWCSQLSRNGWVIIVNFYLARKCVVYIEHVLITIHTYQSKDREPVKGSTRNIIRHEKNKMGKYAWLRFKINYHLVLQRMPLASCLVGWTVSSLSPKPPLPEPTWDMAICWEHLHSPTGQPRPPPPKPTWDRAIC